MIDSTSDVPERPVTAAQTKRKYVAPELTAFGSVEDFTRSGGSKSVDGARRSKQTRG